MSGGISPRAFFVLDALAVIGVSYFAPEYLLAGSKFLSFASILTASLLWVLVYRAQIWPKLLSPLRKLPQAPGASMWTGNFTRIRKQDTGIPMREWINSVPNKGLIRYTMLFNEERVLLASPEALREVLVTKAYDFAKPQMARNILGRLLGYGVLLAEGEEHKFQRKNLMPAFAYRHVKDLVPGFWTKSAEMVRAIDKDNDSSVGTATGAIVEISEWLSRCTLDIIGISGMGFDFGALKDPNTELNRTYRAVFSPSRQAQILELVNVVFGVPLWFIRALPLSRELQVRDSVSVIRRISRDVVREKQRKMDAAKEKGQSMGAAVDKDIISVAVESGAFSEENLVDQVMTFLAAGHETTSTATTWAMLALARNPGVQAKLRDEIRENLPSPTDADAIVTAEQIDSMHYLHAFCNEVLRFHPPVPMTRRVVLRETEICGTVIPKGVEVILTPMAVNFSREMWGDDADDFRPERWLGKNANSGGATSNFAQLTFLHGPRSCIGQKFSQVEFACLVAAIVGHYSVELAEPDAEIKVISGVTQRPKGGLPLRLKEISGW